MKDTTRARAGDQARLGGASERCRDLDLTALDHLRDGRGREVAPEHRGDLEQLACLGVEARDAVVERGTDGRWQR
ncbi:MAG: hypothetical protein IPK07_25610 [Deltaproteobacteria bacterium]|nr:hypothetical protein [Deltaproteobacteria bacterium]